MKRDSKKPQEKKPVDWPHVRSRLEAAIRLTKQDLEASADEKQKILRARARALSKEKEIITQDTEVQVLEFILAYERYGMDLSSVREVYPLKDLTPLPSAPDFVLGVIHIRGQILSLLNLKKFFGLPEKGLTDFNKVIIIENETLELGILADGIEGIRTVSSREMQANLPLLTGNRQDYLRGVTQDRLILLDAQKILSDEKIKVS